MSRTWKRVWFFIDIQIGRCVVVADPWENRLVLLDGSKGMLQTDADGNVTGNSKP